jgi:type IV pilus assembly protein PilM
MGTVSAATARGRAAERFRAVYPGGEMAISMFSSQALPIAIDFGASSIKMLQVMPDDPPTLVAAAELEIPEAIRNDLNARMQFLGEQIPTLLRKLRFKGKRAMFSIPSLHTFVQHVQVPTSGALVGEEFIRTTLQAQTGYAASNLVIRTSEVAEIVRDGHARHETICFAVPKDVVMKHIDLLKRCKLEVVGVHTEQQAVAWAYEHLCRRREDAERDMLVVDIGWASTKAAISQGHSLLFAKTINLGGTHIEKAISSARGCDVSAARAMFRTEGEAAMARSTRSRAKSAQSAVKPALVGAAANGGGSRSGASATAMDRRSGQLAPSLIAADDSAAAPQLMPEAGEIVESIADELAMCLRYFQVHFGRPAFEQIVYTGGVAQHFDLCRIIADRLSVTPVMGDPMGRARGVEANLVHGFTAGSPLPGWTVACGLCAGVEHS